MGNLFILVRGNSTGKFNTCYCVLCFKTLGAVCLSHLSSTVLNRKKEGNPTYEKLHELNSCSFRTSLKNFVDQNTYRKLHLSILKLVYYLSPPCPDRWLGDIFAYHCRLHVSIFVLYHCVQDLLAFFLLSCMRDLILCHCIQDFNKPCFFES
jgi:hypothetical protein